MVCSLKDLQPGQKCRIVKVGGAGELRKRIVEMGITAGKTVEIERVAPLGDPVEIIIMGYHLSLRRAEMARITVEPMEEHHT
jgi:Fe2+ transport system protein FeoA